nr:PDDEXK nuclease domain-containing protein [Spirosomataceae bacterium]
YNMVAFFETYSSPQFLQLIQSLEIVQKETGQLEEVDSQTNVIVQNLSGQLHLSPKMAKFLLEINWSMHVEILNHCKLIEQKIFYILYAQKEKLNYRELQRAIKTNAYTSVLKAESNQSKGMEIAYPASNYLFKDVAYLDFLGLPQKYNEKRLQNEILSNMKDFILELGKDFLFIGQEYPVQVGGKTFKIDFFHRALQCLVAIELKTSEFEPAFMGQLEFYLEALDNDVKRSNENPSIGILLCKETNREIVRTQSKFKPNYDSQIRKRINPQRSITKIIKRVF